MKPFYSIRELAELLNEEVYRVADGLVACGIPAIFMGKEIVLAKHECFQPPRQGTRSTIYVFTGDRPAEPSAGNVIVATEKFPESWIVALTEPETSIEHSTDAKPLTTTDNTLVSTIAALLAAWPGGKPPSGKDLEKAASSVGVSVSDDSIRKALRLAKEIAPSLKSA